MTQAHLLLQHLVERHFEGDKVLSKGTQGHFGGDLFLLEVYLSRREAVLHCQPGHGLEQLTGITQSQEKVYAPCVRQRKY
jgi:hypothetical protein